MFQQSVANLIFFPYRLHNETLDKKINSTHDYQDYYNSFGVETSGNTSTVNARHRPPTSNLL